MFRCWLRRGGFMRADIVAGAVFPDYELTDHTGERRKVSELQGPDPMILVLSRGGFARRNQRKPKGWSKLSREWKFGSPRPATIRTNTCLPRMITAAALELI